MDIEILEVKKIILEEELEEDTSLYCINTEIYFF